jgi:hypothetical protein
MSFLGELKRRKIAQVAAVYLVVAWLLVQVIDVINEPLSLPSWFDTVVILLLAIGFPIAVILAWAFDLTPEGVIRAPSGEPAMPSDSRKLEYALLGLIVAGIGWLVVRDSVSFDKGDSARVGTPVVILMDTSAPHGVYDQETRDNSGTNADVLNDVLRELPIIINKEAIGSGWDREDQILKQNPDMILVHRSGFYHSMNLEFGFSYADNVSTDYERYSNILYDFAVDKLISLLGYIGQGNADTVFLVYSRGTSAAWKDSGYRDAWIARVERRFPSLKARVNTMAVPGGAEGGSFRDPDTADIVRQQVRSLLNIEDQSGAVTN